MRAKLNQRLLDLQSSRHSEIKNRQRVRDGEKRKARLLVAQEEAIRLRVVGEEGEDTQSETRDADFDSNIKREAARKNK